MPTSKGAEGELVVAAEGMKRGWGVLQDLTRISTYDLVFAVKSRFCRIQVKTASANSASNGKTVSRMPCSLVRGGRNLGGSRSVPYQPSDFDFAVIYVGPPKSTAFYVVPIKAFIAGARGRRSVPLPEAKDCLDPRMEARWLIPYHEAWDLIEAWAEN